MVATKAIINMWAILSIPIFVTILSNQFIILPIKNVVLNSDAYIWRNSIKIISISNLNANTPAFCFILGNSYCLSLCNGRILVIDMNTIKSWKITAYPSVICTVFIYFLRNRQNYIYTIRFSSS